MSYVTGLLEYNLLRPEDLWLTQAGDEVAYTVSQAEDDMGSITFRCDLESTSLWLFLNQLSNASMDLDFVFAAGQ